MLLFGGLVEHRRETSAGEVLLQRFRGSALVPSVALLVPRVLLVLILVALALVKVDNGEALGCHVDHAAANAILALRLVCGGPRCSLPSMLQTRMRNNLLVLVLFILRRGGPILRFFDCFLGEIFPSRRRSLCLLPLFVVQ